ncbi:MAG: hypothetical protein H6540_06345 [Bacteroidales bacterium]|nr:hypothetical protein [Bacteroidales bacterium]
MYSDSSSQPVFQNGVEHVSFSDYLFFPLEKLVDAEAASFLAKCFDGHFAGS